MENNTLSKAKEKSPLNSREMHKLALKADLDLEKASLPNTKTINFKAKYLEGIQKILDNE